MSKLLVLVQDKSIINKVKEVEKATFLFPLEGYSVGFPKTYNLNEIDEFASYILVNRILDEKSITSLKEEFQNFPKNIKGIVFEDLGVLELVKDLDITKILWQNHLNNSYKTIDSYLKYVDSVMVQSDITFDEIKTITENVSKELVLPVLGYQGVMYSRRYLLSNFGDHFNETISNPNIITEKALKEEFRIYENESGTQLYYNKIFDGRKLFELPALYYFINTLFIPDEDIISFIKGKELVTPTTDGFLNKKTIYKLKEDE